MSAPGRLPNFQYKTGLFLLQRTREGRAGFEGRREQSAGGSQSRAGRWADGGTRGASNSGVRGLRRCRCGESLGLGRASRQERERLCRKREGFWSLGSRRWFPPVQSVLITAKCLSRELGTQGHFGGCVRAGGGEKRACSLWLGSCHPLGMHEPLRRVRGAVGLARIPPAGNAPRPRRESPRWGVDSAPCPSRLPSP